MVYENKGNSLRYLVCSNARRKLGSCTRLSWPYLQIEYFIIATLSEIDYGAIFPELNANSREVITNIENDILTREHRFTIVNRQLDDSIDLLLNMPNNLTLRNRVNELDTEKQTLQVK